VWTLVTGVFLERNFLALVLHVSVLWMFVPTLERFWGTARFYRFVAITSLAGTVAGCAFGLAIGDMNVAISGLDPFIYAAIVAFGIVYARQPVQFFGVLPLTGRQLMYGILGFLVFSVLIQQHWTLGIAYGAAMLAAAILTSKRWSPALAWKRWRISRARARLKVMSGGKGASKPRDEHKWLN
jgi:membrane associated rhomboid family serine protease